MNKPGDRQLVICERLRKLGYARESYIRLYGEEFLLLSDPIPDGDGFCVQGITRHSGKARAIRIPLPVVHTLKQELTFALQFKIAA